MIRRIHRFGVLLVALCCAGVQSMTLERVDDTLYATGVVGNDDFLTFKAQFAQPGLRRLVLVDSPGGELWTALKVGEMVRDAGLETVAVGKCLSACAVLFVAGKSRAYGTGRKPSSTLLGIHGGYDPDTGRLVGQGVGPTMYAFYRRQIGAAMDDGIINEAIYGFKESSGFLVMPVIEHNPPKTSQRGFVPTCMTQRLANPTMAKTVFRWAGDAANHGGAGLAAIDANAIEVL